MISRESFKQVPRKKIATTSLFIDNKTHQTEFFSNFLESVSEEISTPKMKVMVNDYMVPGYTIAEKIINIARPSDIFKSKERALIALCEISIDDQYRDEKFTIAYYLGKRKQVCFLSCKSLPNFSNKKWEIDASLKFFDERTCHNFRFLSPA
jgi:hypothetical protein